jgi:glycosyltransferase involved in cell wall biosynthesis
MRPLTVAIDARLLGTTNTGDTSYWRGLVSGLTGIEADARFLLLSNSTKVPGVPDDSRFEWIHVPALNNRLWSLISFPRAARRLRADVIHTQYNVSPLCGRHAVTTVHDVSFLVGPEWFKATDRFLLKTQIPSSIRRAARVITVSETSKNDIERFIPASIGKVRVTPNALGANIQPLSAEQAMRVVADLGIKGPYVFTVGTRWPRKNMQLALDAVAKLPADMPHQIVVTGKVGWGEEKPSPRVHFTGYVEDRQLTALYQCAELYLAPSRYEGFGIPLLEAFACRCPVLCSSGGSFPEVAGDAAFVEPSWDPAVWAERIRELLADSRKLAEMRERGLKRVADFDWKTTARLTLDVYREAAQ